MMFFGKSLRACLFLSLVLVMANIQHAYAYAPVVVGNTCTQLGETQLADNHSELAACLLSTANGAKDCTSGGGCKWKSMTSSGVSLTAHAVNTSRAAFTVYQNTTGTTMFVGTSCTSNNGSEGSGVFIGPTSPPTIKAAGQSIPQTGYMLGMFFIVPAGWYYREDFDKDCTLSSWVEYY